MADVEKKLDAILLYLKSQNDSLRVISQHLDTIDAEMKMISQSQRHIGKRQAALEDHYAEQAGSCTSVMSKLGNRLTSIEQQLSPIPTLFIDTDKAGDGK